MNHGIDAMFSIAIFFYQLTFTPLLFQKDNETQETNWERWERIGKLPQVRNRTRVPRALAHWAMFPAKNIVDGA